MLTRSLPQVAARIRPLPRAHPFSNPHRLLVRLSRSWARAPGDSFMPQSVSAASGLGDPRIPRPAPQAQLAAAIPSRRHFAQRLRLAARPSVCSEPASSLLASVRQCSRGSTTCLGSFLVIAWAGEAGCLCEDRRPPGAPLYACCSIGLRPRPSSSPY
ncbi:hypothetical protein NDU88_004755 [Pleurodeles waltl]|uniref:Uncharacterized protein n=1 Tax=Pleurodeles waltl TaxID=8319 RepID=A0AAV7PGM0_PLEWA|nr:hypothetical protein NDU88_004755 [Pleurodeles waltl]